MALRGLLQPWDQQPSGDPGLDPNWCPPGSVVCTPFRGATRVAGASTTVTRAGTGFATPSAGNYWQASASKVISNLDRFTLAVYFQHSRAATSGGYTLFGERGSSGNDILKIVCGENGHSGNGIGAVIRNTAGSLQRITPAGTTVNDGVPHTAVLVKRAANSWILYLDGVQVGQNTTNLPGSGFTGSTPLNICYDLQDSSKAFEGVVLAVATPNYPWTAEQIREWANNPWQVFADDVLYVPRAAAAGATYTLTAQHGSFTLTGQAANLRAARNLVAGAGAFTFTGQAAGLQVGRKLAAGTGAFTLTGNDATLTYTPGVTYTLAADTGAFTLTGIAAGLRAGRVLAADTGSYALTGNAAGFVYSGGVAPSTDGQGGFLGGFKEPKRKRNRVIRWSDFESRDAYAKELAAAAMPLARVSDPRESVYADDDEDDELIELLLMKLH